MKLINNTSGYHEGSTAVCNTFRKMTEKYNLTDKKICIINGEGTFHHNRTKAGILCKKAGKYYDNGFKVFLINTLWQDNSGLEKYLDMFTGIWTRESLSADEIIKAGYKVEICPDLAFYRGNNPYGPLRRKHRELYIDSVNRKVSNDLARKADTVGAPFIKMRECDNTEKRIRQSGKVYTGRFHGAVFCVKHNIPFEAFPSNSHKTDGLVKDLYKEYADDADDRIENMFKHISELS